MEYKGTCCSCEKCVKCRVNEQPQTMVIRGLPFNFLMKRAFCPICGDEVYIPEVHDENCNRRNEAFIIAHEKRYGKRPKGM